MNRPENLKPLTTMRFFAAAWVVLYHYWPLLVAGEKPALVARGYLGVELFFVLSGFILSHVYLESFGARTFSYGRFLWARLARIYPVHLAWRSLVLLSNSNLAMKWEDTFITV